MRWLTLSSPDPETQRRGSTLLAALALSVVSFLVGAAVFWWIEPTHISSLLLLGGLSLLAVSAVLVRRHLDAAVGVYAVVLWLVVVGQPAVNGDLSTNAMLVPIAAIVLLTVARRGQTWLIVIWVVSSLGILLVVTTPEATIPLLRQVWLSNAALMTAAGLAIIAVAHRQLQIAWRRQQELANSVSAYDRLITELRQESLTDPLTGLSNRRAFDEVSDLPVATNGGGAVAVIDLDRLKSVNDTYSHSIGDELLRAFATELRSRMRRSDTLFRSGGDEFVLVSPSSGAEGLSHWLTSLEGAFASSSWPTLPEGVRPRLSAGVVSSGSAASLRDAVRRADDVLRRAKAAGGGQVLVEEAGGVGRMDGTGRDRS